MEIINKKLNELKPYKKNPRKNDNAVDYVAKSIKEFGFKVPIVIDKNNVIIAGHTRYKASEKLGLEEVPCIIADDLTEEQVKAFRLADNKVSEMSEWDYDLLNMELDDIVGIDMEDFGFLDLDTEEEKEVEEDDFDVEPPEEPKAKYGDIYQLGEHRLMCGDSTKEEDVTLLMNENKADLVVTDPPYNVDYTGKTKDALKIENDKMQNNDFHNFLYNAFKNIYDFLKDGGGFYIWYASREVVNFQTALEENDLEVKQELIWNKNSLVLGRQDYQWKHEPCLYGWKNGASHNWYAGRKETTIFEDKNYLDLLSTDELKDIINDLLNDKFPSTIFCDNKPLKSNMHPTMKPIKLLSKQIKNSSKKEDIILDLFGGSGSTLIACEQLNRKCYMMEYDPKYVDVIIERWEKFTGKKAELIRKGE